MKKRSIYRIILIIAGALHLLPFFVVPYATLEGLMGGLGQLAGAMGMGDAYPEKLTGLNAIQMASLFGQDEGFILVLFALPAVAGVLVVLLNLFGNGKVSYDFTALPSIVGAACYGLLTIALQDFASIGYSGNAVVYIFLVLSVAQIIVAVVGFLKDKGIASASSGKKVKVGKKDGTITGVRGSYAGAVIPVKSGDTIVIGRDPSTCSIVIKDENASRKHCTVAYNADNGMYAVTDYSTNGVFDRDGNRIAEKVAVPMSAGSEIRIGKNGDVFRLG